MSSIEFEVLYDDCLYSKYNQADFAKKYMLSFINGFQDGNWRVDLFHEFIWNNINETALSAKERDALILKPFSAMKASAINLHLSEDEKGGEIGEIFLYGVLKKHYNALPIVPKIFYKQNTQDYAKGADSVHIVIDESNVFSIWIGESKFYDDLTSSHLDKIVKSISETLSTEKLRKEFNIVTSLQDLELVCQNPEISKRIRNLLSNGVSLDEIKEYLNVPIMILHECKITSTQKAISEAYKKNIIDYHLGIAEKYIKKQNEALKTLFCYDKIFFRLFLFPVPNKNNIVDNFVEQVEHFRKRNG